MKKRLLIGIITAKVVAPEQKHTLDGILNKAQELGIHTFIFSNIYNYNEYPAHVEIENRIYDLITLPQIDGIILTADSIFNPDIRQYIDQHIMHLNVPIVVIGAEIPGMCCVNNDIVSDFEEITQHLTDVHHFTEIDILTGNQEIETSHLRVKGCRNVLERHGISLPDENILYGDFSTNSVEATAMEYVQKKRRLPQAIICANDYMAFGLCDIFHAYGIHVPEDVTIIGYEHAWSRVFHVPVLATYFRNRQAVGMNAMELLYSKMTEQKPKTIPFRGEFIHGDSCPCGINRERFYHELSQTIQFNSYLYACIDSMFEHHLTVCRNIEDYIQVLQNFAYIIRDVAGVYLCLYEDWYSMDLQNHVHTNDSLMLCYCIISSQKVSNEPIFFKRSQLCPQTIKPDICYFAPVSFSGREFGYFILQYDKPDSYDDAFKIWLKNASGGLEALRMKNDIHTLLECQNLSEFYDTTTGLLNRDGFYHEIQHALHKSTPEEKLILVLIRTALFSDNTSIDGKDIFIKTEKQIAECLKKFTAGVNKFCAKIGDSFFAVGCIGQYKEGEENLLSDKLNTLILHLPLYSEYHGIDTLLCTAVQTDALQAEKQADFLHHQMQLQIEALTAARNNVNFLKYHIFRSSMYREPHKEWDVQKICRNFHMSCGYFQTTYKKLFGISFHQDIIQSRISLAKYLLLTTPQSLHSIAVQCGYRDDKYFNRQFCKLTGFTPLRYRNTK